MWVTGKVINQCISLFMAGELFEFLFCFERISDLLK